MKAFTSNYYYVTMAAILFSLMIGSILRSAIRRATLLHMGMNQDMDRSKSHGTAWVTRTDGGVTPYHFIVDRPHRLQKPKRYIVADLFRQVKLMGMHAQSLEIKCGNKVHVYTVNDRSPVVV